jgi:Rod binding domain-containing protein
MESASIGISSGASGLAQRAELAASSGQREADAIRSAMEEGRADEAADAVEGLFARMLVKEFRRGLPNGFFQGTGADVFNGWLDEHLGNALSSRDALGLGGMVKASLGRNVVPAEEALNAAEGER